jgi:hypothetical protein
MAAFRTHARESPDEVHLKLRLDEALRQQIADAAKSSLRSMNSEIVYRLRKSLSKQAAA